MKFRSLISCVTFVATMVASLYSQKISASPEFIGLQEKAEGQSLTGANLLNDSLYTNPAASAFTNVYSVEGDYYATPQGAAFGASVLDTKTSSAGGALGYFRTPFQNYADPMQGLKASLSERVNNILSMGIAGKLIWGPSIPGAETSYKDADAGFLFNWPSFQLGGTIRNIFGGNVALDQEREWSVGARISWEDVLFFSVSSVSTWQYFTPYQVGVGAEFLTPYYFSIKCGYRILTENGYGYYSAGISLITPKVSLHYALEVSAQATSPMESSFGATFMF